MADRITTGPLEARKGLLGWQVEGKDGDGTYVVARFYEEAAEANARAFVMVEQMVGALREIVRTYGSMETGDGEPCPVVANVCSILARIDEDALR